MILIPVVLLLYCQIELGCHASPPATAVYGGTQVAIPVTPILQDRLEGLSQELEQILQIPSLIAATSTFEAST